MLCLLVMQVVIITTSPIPTRRNTVPLRNRQRVLKHLLISSRVGSKITYNYMYDTPLGHTPAFRETIYSGLYWRLFLITCNFMTDYRSHNNG